MNLGPADVRGVGLSIDQLEDCEANAGERKIDSFFSKQPSASSSSSRQFSVEKLEDFDDVSVVDEAPMSLGGARSDFHRPPTASSSSAESRRGPTHFELVYEASSSSVSSQDSSQSNDGTTKHDFAKADTKIIPNTPPRSADESLSGHLSYNWDEYDDDAMSLSSEVEMYEFSEWNESELQILDVKPGLNPKQPKKRARPQTDDVIVLDDDDDTFKPPPRKRQNATAAAFEPQNAPKTVKQPALSDFARKK
jgi:hypothetical protein